MTLNPSRILLLSVPLFVVAACASVDPQPTTQLAEGEREDGPVTEQERDVEPARTDEPAGYALTGRNFDAALIYEERRGRAIITYSHQVAGAPQITAELDLGEPWMAGGVRRFQGVSDQGLDVSVSMYSGPCAAGQGEFSRFAEISIGRVSYEGCARETGPVQRWTELLPGALPLVQTCQDDTRAGTVAFARQGTARITHARVEDGQTVLRYQFGSRGRWDCRQGRSGTDWTIVPDTAAALTGEGNPIFVVGDVPAAGDACFLYERFVDADGAVLGAIGEDACYGGSSAPESAAP